MTRQTEPPGWAIRSAAQLVRNGDPHAEIRRRVALALARERSKASREGDVVLVDRQVLDKLRSSARSLLFFIKTQPADDAAHAADLTVLEAEVRAAAERAERALGIVP